MTEEYKEDYIEINSWSVSWILNPDRQHQPFTPQKNHSDNGPTSKQGNTVNRAQCEDDSDSCDEFEMRETDF